VSKKELLIFALVAIACLYLLTVYFIQVNNTINRYCPHYEHVVPDAWDLGMTGKCEQS
jgi:hypothetical protein